MRCLIVTLKNFLMANKGKKRLNVKIFKKYFFRPEHSCCSNNNKTCCMGGGVGVCRVCGPCKNSSWINFCQLWLKCVVLDVSDTIVLSFILLLASLAPATINPTMVRQELQVTVARVTVVRSHRHHYSSSRCLSAAACAQHREGWGWLLSRGGGGGKLYGQLSVGLASCCRRTCDLLNLLGVGFFLPLPKGYKNQTSDRNIF